MANTISEYFTDEDLEQSLRLQFEYDEMWSMDFRSVFNQISDEGDYLQLKLRGRIFRIDKITGGVSEVKT